MFLLDLILELLDEKNGWFSLEEIASKTKISKSETATLVKFLAEYSFAILDTRNQKARINPKIHEFLQETRQLGKPTSICRS